MSERQFNFGENWQDYSDNFATVAQLKEACEALESLVGSDNLRGSTMLDIGCGSGLHALAALRAGAERVVATDVNPLCLEVTQKNLSRFQRELPKTDGVEIRGLDVLDAEAVVEVGTFPLVYSWGVLHHTGDMWRAIRHASQCVAEEGMFVIAIYNRHWTSPIWHVIKWLYMRSPQILRTLMVWLLAVPMFFGAWFTTGRMPWSAGRGMHFYHDLIDWVGGYPYECASIDEMTVFVEELGFELVRSTPTAGWTGCNEFVFHRNAS